MALMFHDSFLEAAVTQSDSDWEHFLELEDSQELAAASPDPANWHMTTKAEEGFETWLAEEEDRAMEAKYDL